MSRLDKVGFLFGVIFTILGIVLLVRINTGYFWAFLLLLLGLLFEFGVLAKGSGRLVPGGIFIVLGTTLLFCSIFGYDKMAYLWPAFILAPGFGLFQLYLVRKSRGLFRASMILIVLSVIFFSANIFRVGWARVLFGVLLVVLGIFVLVKSVGRKVE